MIRVMKMTGTAVALAALSCLWAGAASAGCGKGSIEVKYAGKDTCVAPEQYATLSDSVKATADADDVAEAMGNDDDNGDDENDDQDDDKDDDKGKDKNGASRSGNDNGSDDDHGGGSDDHGDSGSDHDSGDGGSDDNGGGSDDD